MKKTRNTPRLTALAVLLALSLGGLTARAASSENADASSSGVMAQVRSATDAVSAATLAATNAATSAASNAAHKVVEAAEGVVSAVFHGRVSYYGPNLAGNLTANGERFDPSQLTMAHPTLPFGTLVRLFNPQTAESVVVRVNDRGPYVRGRIADVSTAAARKLRMIAAGVVPLRLEVLSSPDDDAADSGPRPRR